MRDTSWIIPIRDIEVTKTSRRWLDEEASVFVVEMKHVPSGMVVSSEHRSQLEAYNQCILLLERYILEANKDDSQYKYD